MKYWFDSRNWTSAESWRKIRTARAEPPPSIAAQVSGGERKVVFQTALEQAQQQYVAAASIGYESRPLNAFYGLAQAGKALAAASPRLDQSQQDEALKSWRTSGHGLKFVLGGGAFWSQGVRVEPGSRDSFSRASIALGSAYDFDSVELGALAAQIPEFVAEWPTFGGWPRCIRIEGAMGADVQRFDLRDYDGEATISSIEAYAAHYPALAGSAVAIDDDDGEPKLDGPFPWLILPASSEGDPGRVWPSGTRNYGSSPVILPRPEGATSDLHPIMAWWLLLFGLSMLARYHPKEWTEALAINTSPIASQVEFLLDAAVSSVPELLARELSTPARPF